MSIRKKIINAYTKALFTYVKQFEIPGKVYVAAYMCLDEDSPNFKPNTYMTGEELLLLRCLFTSSETLRTYFNDPTHSETDKYEVIKTIFPGLSRLTKHFLEMLVARHHLKLLPYISSEFTKLMLEAKKSTNIKIIFGSAAREQDAVLVLETLKKFTRSKALILSAAFREQLLGGVLLEYKSVSVNGSLSNEMEQLLNEI